MQFHLNGFRPGSPHIAGAAAALESQRKDVVDVLIVGCGPAGLTLRHNYQLLQISIPELSNKKTARWNWARQMDWLVGHWRCLKRSA